MKNKFTKKYKNVLITKSAAGMAKLSLADVLGISTCKIIIKKAAHKLRNCAAFCFGRTLSSLNSSTPRARALSYFGSLISSSQRHRDGSTPRARALSLRGVFEKIYVLTSSIPRARKLSLIGHRFTLFVISLILLLPLLISIISITKNEQVQAATSNELNFQGRLLDASGNLVADGTYNMEFNLYYVSAAGSPVWTEDRLVTNSQGVSVQNGYYSVYLGEYDAFGAIDWSQDLYLGMTIRGTANCAWISCTPADSEMTPRFKLTAVPYAFRASNVASSDVDGGNSDNVSITTGDTTTSGNSGNITIDVGSAAGTAGTITVGGTNATGLTLGNSSIQTTIAGTALVQGASLTVGTASQSGSLVLNDGDGETGTLQVASLGSNEVYIFPDSDGSDTVCLLDLANCTANLTLQGVYNNDSDDGIAAITLTSTDGEIAIRDAASTIGDLFVVESNDGSSDYLVVNSGYITAGVQLRATGGSAGAPGYAFSSSSTTGLYYSGGILGLSNNSNEVRLEADGDLFVTGGNIYATESADGQPAFLSIENTFTAGGSTDETAQIQLGLASGQIGVRLVAGKESDFTSAANRDSFFAVETRLNGTTAEKLRVTSSGNVGIGETAPGAKLEVDTDIGDNVIGLIIDQDDTTNNNAALVIQNAGTGDSINIDSGEFIVSSTGAITTTSDLTVQGNTTIGNANTDTLTINAGSSGTGITFADSSFQNCTLTTSGAGVLTCVSGTPLTNSLTDNVADAFDLQEGTNNYININTTDASENISFGNATTNPSYNFLGTGTVTIAGDLAVNGGDLTTDQTTFNLLNTTATTLNIGGAATTLELGAATGTTSVNNALTVDGLITGSLGLTVTGAATNLNVSSNFDTNINTGTSSGAVNIGSSNAGAITIQSGTSIGMTGPTTITGAASGNALVISNSTSTGNILVLQDNATQVLAVGDGGDFLFNIENTNVDAFQVRDQSSNVYFNIDTTNNRVSIGDSSFGGSDTVLNLNTGSTQSDPAGLVEGSIYYNPQFGKFRCNEGGVIQNCIRDPGVFEAARKQQAYASGTTASATFADTPVEGNLLIAISTHRSEGSVPSITGSGWTLVSNECYGTVAGGCGTPNTSLRRATAIWYKIAGASEPTNIQTSWDGSPTNFLQIEEYETKNGSFVFENYAVANSGASTTTSQTTGTTAAVSSANGLSIGIMTWRGSGQIDSWTNGIDNTYRVSVTSGESSIATGYDNYSTAGTKESTATIDTSVYTLGAILNFSIESGRIVVQDGNSFGEALTIGTNDNYGVNIKTNGTTALSIDTSGDTTLVGDLTVQGGSAVLGVASTTNGQLILQNSTNAFTVTLQAPSQTTGSAVISFPDTAGVSDTICLYTLSNCGGGDVSSSLTDNISDALDIQEGTNNYININTTDSSENISFGNATTNPSYNFLGGGTLSVAGDLAVNTDTLYVDTTSEYIGINNSSPNANLDIIGTGNTVLTGSIDPTASTLVFGVGTAFTTELEVGDAILVSGEIRTVTGISSDTALVVSEAFTDNANDTSPEKLASGLRVANTGEDKLIKYNGQQLYVYAGTDSTTTADTKTASTIFINDDGAVSSGTDNTIGLKVAAGNTGASGGTINTYGVYGQASGDTGGTSSIYGVYGRTVSGADNSYGVYGEGRISGSGTYTSSYGVHGSGGGFGTLFTGTLSSAYGGRFNVTAGDGAITDGYGVYVSSASVAAGSITNNYGIYVQNQTVGGTDYGIYVADAENYSLYLASTDGDAASGITFGGDTNLYRSAANTLFTDDSLSVNTDFTVNGNTTIGNANSDTLTINAGSSGTGITFADSSFQGCTLTTSGAGVLTCVAGTPIVSSLTDNVADALDLQEGTNNYININTTDGSENISFGNATTNPSYDFLGTGTLSVGGKTAFLTEDITFDTASTFENALTVGNGATITIDNDSAYRGVLFNPTIEYVDPFFLTGGRSFEESAILKNPNATVQTLPHQTGFYAHATVQGDGATFTTNRSAFLDNTIYSVINSGTVSATKHVSYEVDLDSIGSGVTITDLRGLEVNDAAGAGTVTNQYGVYIDNLTKGGTDYGIYVSDAENYSLYLASTDGDAASGITFGSDTNLYRSAANTLRTDDNLVVAGGALTLGVANTTAGSIVFNDDSSTNTITLNTANLTAANIVYEFADPTGGTGTYQICTTDGNCDGSGGLQGAYAVGNTITATDAYGDIDLTVSEATNFSVDITGTGSFLVQDGGTNILSVRDKTGVIITSNVAIELTGDINPIASTAVTGVGTAFTTELNVGDVIDVNGERRVVIAIASDTSLTVLTAFTNTPNDTTPEKIPAQLLVRNSSGASKMFVNDNAVGTLLTSTNTTGVTERGSYISVTDTGIVTTGTDTTYGLDISVTRTGATGGTINTYGLQATATGDVAGAGTSTNTGVYGLSSNGDINIGVQGSALSTGSSTITRLDGVRGTAGGFFSTGNITEANALVGYINNAAFSGTVTDAAGLRVESATTSATITNNYGIYVENQTVGGSDYGIYVAGADTYALWIDSGATRIDGAIGIGTVTNSTCGTNCTLTQSNVDNYSVVIAEATASGLEITLPDPTDTTAGKIIYITAANGTEDFTLVVNGGGQGNEIAMRADTTATMIWNGSDWTAAGASSSTTLQAAYDNTLTSAGGAEIVLNPTGGAADGLTIRNNSTTPISGGILEVQSAIGTNLFSVNNIATEYVANGGAEDSTSFSSDWTLVGSSTITRNTTGANLATGTGSVQMVTTAAANDGVRNNLATNLAVSTQYLISFTAKTSSGTWANADMEVLYSRDGGTDEELCTNASTADIVSTGWTKFTCTITTDGTSPSNADLIIRQTDATARTVYIDNLSINENSASSAPDNVQIGGGIYGGPVTLFTLDRASAPPVANGDETYLGSMYYDTVTGRIQCYEADGWGACGSAPNNYVNLNPEYPGSVLNGTGVGTMVADFCGNGGGLSVNTSFCASGEARNYYAWTSPQGTQQTYSIYITYQLPAEFGGFESNSTVQLTGRSDNLTNGYVTYEMYRNEGGTIVQCGTETTVVGGGTGTVDTWETVGINGNEADGCGFSSTSADDFVIFKINMKANSNATVYASTLSFTTVGQ